MAPDTEDITAPWQVYVGLGSNQGTRADHLDEAVRRLQPLGFDEFRVSAYFETAPFDMRDDSGPFLNAAVSFMSRHGPRELLTALLHIERDMGRPKGHGFHVARIIDLDLIAVDDVVMCEEDLVLPHPRAHERDFVLMPLAEIAPDLRLPGQARTVRELLAALVGD